LAFQKPAADIAIEREHRDSLGVRPAVVKPELGLLGRDPYLSCGGGTS
jgi:hypothetical protein